MSHLIRYRVFLLLFSLTLLLTSVRPSIGIASLVGFAGNLEEIALFLPPIFAMIGLIDVWVEKETMIRYLGEASGVRGIFIAFLLGSVAVGPLYAAFPFAGILFKKGSTFFNILIFIGAWSATKIAPLMFEAAAMGWKFMLARFAADIAVILFIAYMTDKMVSSEEKQTLSHAAEKIL